MILYVINTFAKTTAQVTGTMILMEALHKKWIVISPVEPLSIKITHATYQKWPY